MVGYSLLTLAVSLFGCEKYTLPEIWRRPWKISWKWRVLFSWGKISLSRGRSLKLGGGFKDFFSAPIWGRCTHFDLRIFFRWVGSTTQRVIPRKLTWIPKIAMFKGSRYLFQGQCHLVFSSWTSTSGLYPGVFHPWLNSGKTFAARSGCRVFGAPRMIRWCRQDWWCSKVFV